MKKILVLFFVFSFLSILFAGDRSSKWPKVRGEYIKAHPVCELTGIGGDINVHHQKPFHFYPELELDPSNFITLTNADVWGIKGVHITIGHLGNFQYYNPRVREDVTALKAIREAHKTFEQAEGEIHEYVENILKVGKLFNKEMRQMIKDTGGLDEKGLSPEQREKVEELIKKFYKEDEEKGVKDEKDLD